MRNYYTFGASELTSAQSHMLISAHGLYDRTSSMHDAERERTLFAMRHAPMHRGSLSQYTASPYFPQDLSVYL